MKENQSFDSWQTLLLAYEGTPWNCNFKPRCRTTVRQHFFSLRIVNEWNKLPQTVIEATSVVNAFKNRLDRHRSDMGVYSWLATQPIINKYKYK